MTKTRRMVTAELGNMDAVCEIIDARIPLSSRNPDIDELTAGKRRIVVLNRVDQADPDMTKKCRCKKRRGREAVRARRARAFEG